MNRFKIPDRASLVALHSSRWRWLLAGAARRRARGRNLPRSPNIVIIFADDQGYADVGCSAPKVSARRTSTGWRRRAASSATSMWPQPVCSASRAGLLTGCYPNRIGIHGALGPGSRVGISSNEMTLAQLVKQRGYATAIFGKWHLGDSQQFLPLQHGFDEYFGLPYSNDMWPLHPDLVNLPPDDPKRNRYPDLPS